MEGSEPSLVPEWLRNSAGGPWGGSSSHHLASSDPLLALPKRNRTSKSFVNFNGSRSSSLEQSFRTNSRKGSSSNGCSKHDKNSYARPCGSSTRNEGNKDRQRLDTVDIWDSEYPGYMASIIPGRIQDTKKCSQSKISRRPGEFSHSNAFTDLRNNNHDVNGHENGAISAASSPTGIKKVSLKRDFPLLGSDERSTMPDMTRLSSLELGRGVQGLHIVPSPSISSEGWTSALAELPVGAGSTSSSILPPRAPDLSPYAATTPTSFPASSSAATSPPVPSASSGLNMTGALALPSALSQNAPLQSIQLQRSEELLFTGSKRLVHMPPSMPKTPVLNPSDKLKPKTASGLNTALSGTKKGVLKMPSLQLGGQPVRGGGARTAGPKSCTTGKPLLLKPARESGFSSSQTVNVSNVIANGQSTCASSVASVPLKNHNNAKLVDKKCSLAQLRSRNEFFNQVRKKSMSNTYAATDSVRVVSSGVQNSDVRNERTSDPLTPTENGSEVKCNGDVCNLDESFSCSSESDLSDDAVIYPDKEEEAFLRSLGWDDSSSEEGGLTEEEINAFVQKVKAMEQSDHVKWRPTSKLCRGLQLKILAEADHQECCPAGVSCKLTADSSV